MNKKITHKLFDEIIYKWRGYEMEGIGTNIYESKGRIVAISDNVIFADDNATTGIRRVSKILTNLTQEKKKPEYQDKIKYKLLASTMTIQHLEDELAEFNEIISIQEAKRFFIIKYKD
jgi:hypothetical protein